jgi:ubiquinone/menaquinone biosynthesis C-methylase UbiE
MKRVVIPELLDSDSGSPSEIAASLSDLRFFNRCFGGIATTRQMVERVARKLGSSSLSWLEVAAGSGDVPQAVARQLEQRGVRLEITLLDRASSHLNEGRISINGKRAVVGDALSLPFPDSSFDLVGSGLFAHHLEPHQLVQFVNEGLRVCRTAVFINDLVRHPLHLALVYAGFPLYRGRLTRHDAPASVRQAYTPGELLALIGQTAAGRVEVHRHYLFRMGVVIWKK